MNFLKIKIDNTFSSGERSDIARIDPTNKEQMERVRVIEKDPETIQYVENLQTTEDGLESFVKGTESKLCVGVFGKESFAKPEEVGKLQGWVYFYPDEEDRFSRLREKKILSNSFKADELYEVSYAKYPGADTGQMSSGLRQAIKALRRDCLTSKIQMVLVAYTDKANVNSERLLMASGFRRTGELEYHVGSEKPDEVWMLKLI